MPVNSITGLAAPKLSITDDREIKFDARWMNLYYGAPEDHQYTNMDCVWYLGREVTPENQKKSHHGNTDMSTDSWELVEDDMLRSQFFPMTMRTLRFCFYAVRGIWPGDGNWDSFHYSPILTILPPRPPKLELTCARNGNTSAVDWSVTVKAQEAVTVDREGTRECYRTNVAFWAKDASGGEIPGTRRAFEFHGTEPEDPDAYGGTIANVLSGFGYDSLVTVHVEAFSSGLAGSCNPVVAERVFARPAKARIGDVCLHDDGGGRIVRVIYGYGSRNATPGILSRHPVASAKVQYVTLDGDATAADAAIASWSDISGASTPHGDIDSVIAFPFGAPFVPDRGKRTWLRVVTERDGLTTYSEPVQLPYFVPLASVDPKGAFILGAGSGDDGQTVYADIAWQSDAETGIIPGKDEGAFKSVTLVTWGRSEHQWQATTKPSEFDMTWEDSPAKLPGTRPPKPDNMTASAWASQWPSYAHTGRVYIDGLTEGEPVFIRARRKVTSKDSESLGDWSQIVTATPTSAPAWSKLDAPDFIARGQSLPLTWTFGADVPQTGWALLDQSGRGWGNGADANGYHVIEADKLSKLSSITLRVSVTTGGSWVDSEPVTTRIVDAPTCSVTNVPARLTSHPLSAKVTATPGCDVSVAVISHGVTYETPSGTKTQYAGDVVWSGTGTGTLSLADVPLVNHCTYDVQAQARDPETGLFSPVAIATFEVAFPVMTGVPGGSVAADEASRSATISTSAPSDAATGDVCDVYRMTPDGAQLIARGIAFGDTVTDRLAPFSSSSSGTSLRYRVCRRSPDGQETWSDLYYSLRAGGIRLDWGDEHVELPYNVESSDSFEKFFDAKTYVNGVTEGYWDEGASRSASLSTDMIRLESAADRELVRRMARYAGPVFVRTGGGLAFEADVQVSGIDESSTSGAVSVSLACTEIALTPEHMCDISEIGGAA